MKFELRQLVKDFVNPDFDSRTRYGDRSVASLKAGEKIIVRREETDVGGVKLELVSFRLLRNGARFERRELVKNVLADSVPVEATTVREYLLLHDEGAYTLNRIMDRLFQNPDVRPLIEAALTTELEAQRSEDYQWVDDAPWNAS